MNKHIDHETFTDIVHKYYEEVVNYLYRFCGDRYLAEDAAQIAFIKCWQNLDTYDKTKTFKPWLFRIAHYTAIDLLRKEYRQGDTISDSVEGKSPTPEQIIEENEQTVYIRNAILQLPEHLRSTIILREYHQMNYRDIAETLNLPIGTVMSRISNARKLLAKSLEPLIEEK